MLHKGQRVQCVDDSNYGMLGYGDDILPKAGETYTIRDIFIDHFGAEAVTLAEIRNDRLPYRVGDKIVDLERGIAAWRFRPLVEGETERELEAV